MRISDWSSDVCSSDLRTSRLDEHAAGLLAPTGAAGYLCDLLECPLRCAEIAPLQPKVGIDHPHQRQIGEVIALGHKLGADNDVDLPRFHVAHEQIGSANVCSPVTHVLHVCRILLEKKNSNTFTICNVNLP